MKDTSMYVRVFILGRDEEEVLVWYKCPVSYLGGSAINERKS